MNQAFYKLLRSSSLVAVLLITGNSCAADADNASSDKASNSSDIDNHVAKFISSYCADCHGGSQPEADLKLDEFDKVDSVSDARDMWERVVEMLEISEMPPDDSPQPMPQEKSRFLAWVRLELEKFDCSEARYPGRVTIRRLNRTEYNNTIRDLVGIDFAPAEDFPADDVGNGFDNMGAVLSLPPILMEKYVEAAEQIVTKALDDPSVRKKLIGAIPDPDGDKSATDSVHEVLGNFAKRAFRRPVTRDELQRLVGLFELAANHGHDYQESIALALKAVLISPHFLFRVELDEDPSKGLAQRELNDYELASRLSYFLWSTMPDEELFDLAEKQQLSETNVLKQQIRRMLGDEKAQALVKNFAGQWLELRNLAKVEPDPGQFPDFDDDLRSAMQRETELFFESVVREDRSILEFLEADFTYVNERLARHYKMDEIKGSEFRKVKLTSNRRGGVLTQASILTLTSNPTRTSPVKRGKWILDNILGTPPPPPPPGVPELEEEGDVELLGSLRERLEQHRLDPSCSVCHKKMDALGFGFENYDAIGAWRETDGGTEIDASGELPGKLTFDGPGELKSLLETARRQQFTRCVAEKLLTYAIGRGLQSYDRCAVRDIVDEAEANGYRFSSLVTAVVNSLPFRMRGTTGEER